MKPIKRTISWRALLMIPAAAGSLLLISACGQSEEQEPTDQETNAEETETTQADDENTQADEGNDVEDDSPGEILTMEEVEQNSSSDSCWAVMDGTVYDLTDWIEEHPGGAERIEGLCGTDAGDAFDSQHGGEDGPERQLAEFEIGTLED